MLQCAAVTHPEGDRPDRRFERIIGKSAALESVLEQVEQVASTDSTVLIEGETGTGKNSSRMLWVADITYIRLRAEFVYLALVLDGFSRRVVGWALQRGITSRLPMAALERAIAERQPSPGLVHHSDRGVQYASGEYVALLNQHQMVPSMSRPANPYDNASCESFIKTLKREEIYASATRIWSSCVRT